MLMSLLLQIITASVESNTTMPQWRRRNVRMALYKWDYYY